MSANILDAIAKMVDGGDAKPLETPIAVPEPNPMEQADESFVRIRVVLVGCGFVGSIFLEEFAKRIYAHQIIPAFEFVLVDDDQWDDRNPANQNATLVDVGRDKVETLQAMLTKYGLICVGVVERLTEENRSRLLDGSDLVVDAVDNYETRKLIWEYSHLKSLPVMHIGVSQAGTGCVDWTWGDKWDNWALSPIALKGRELPKDDVKQLPPCELISLRGLGLNVGFAAAKAASIFFGHDAEKHVAEVEDPFHAMSSWTAHTQGHQLLSVVLYDDEKQEVTKEIMV